MIGAIKHTPEADIEYPVPGGKIHIFKFPVNAYPCIVYQEIQSLIRRNYKSASQKHYGNTISSGFYLPVERSHIAL